MTDLGRRTADLRVGDGSAPDRTVHEMPGVWELERGAVARADGSVRFSVWAPAVQRLAVRLNPGADGECVVDLEPRGGGLYERVVADVAVGTEYLFRLDGDRDRPDPVSRYQPHGVHGPSRVVDHRAHEWSDGAWRGRSIEDLVLYELHIGTFTAEGTFDAARERLAYLADLGVTAIEVMPIAEFPGGRNWGYDGVYPYAPQSTYGGPDGLRRLVDAAHGEGLAVVLDVVYNHLGPEGNYLREYGPYFTARYETPWGDAVNFDGPDSDQVRRYFIENALYCVTDFHIDGLRLDAVHAIYDFSARHILEELAAAVHRQAESLDREVVVIAESDLNDPRLVRPRSRGGYELDAQWSDDFHHAVHAALTGERAGYYADFGGTEPVARALEDRFVLDGGYSTYRRRRHGAPAVDVPTHRFVVFIQNHDQVGNRARGERLSTLVTASEARLAAAVLLLSPYVPLLFMGEEYGETNPFLYFIDHSDRDLLDAVRRGRQREFSAFGWQGEIPDPGALGTFERSRPDYDRVQHPSHAERLHLYRDLLEIRLAGSTLRPGRVPFEVLREADCIALLYGEGRDPSGIAGFNFSDEDRGMEVVCREGIWRLRLSTDSERYGGPGVRAPESLSTARPAPIELTIPGHTAVLYLREES